MSSPFRPDHLPKRRTPSTQPLADLLRPCLGPTLSRQGFGEADVLMHWPEIVGEALAEHCRPVKLQWRPRQPGPDARNEPATLVVRVEGAYALMLQHMTAVVIERVNVYFGWRCVGRLVLKQGPLPVAPLRRAPAPAPDPAARRRAADIAGDVGDPGLHDALVALGGHVLRGRRDATRAGS